MDVKFRKIVIDYLPKMEGVDIKVYTDNGNAGLILGGCSYRMELQEFLENLVDDIMAVSNLTMDERLEVFN